MRRFIVPSLTTMMVLAFTAAAAAEGTGTQAGREGSVGATNVPETNAAPPAGVTVQTPATSEEATAPAPDAAKSNAKLKAIQDRAAKMPAADREEIEKKLQANAKDVDVEAVTNGDATVADRFATEFGLTSEALLAERTAYNVGWGEVMIVHTLLASAPAGTTLDHLYTLHQDGLGWGQIAYGMGLRAGSVAAAVKTEAMVARGTVKADGKTAKIGSNTRVASASGTRSRAGQTKASGATSAAAGTGVK